MRYKVNLILLAIALVSKVCCKGEYWLDNKSDSFKWFGTRTGWGFRKPGERVAINERKEGTNSFRPIPETEANEVPQIVIEFCVKSPKSPKYTATQLGYDVVATLSLSKSKIRSILVQSITFTKPLGDLKTLKEQTEQMGKTMAALFCSEIRAIDGLTYDPLAINPCMVKMLGSFVITLSANQAGLTPENKEALSNEFANGMNDYIKDHKNELTHRPHIAYGVTLDKLQLTPEQTKLIIKFTQGMLNSEYSSEISDELIS